jgi:protein tyrosine phosphatase
MLLNSDSSEKAIIHCSAGIGRTGTTAALSHLMISIASQKNNGVKDPVISVFGTVRRLREQRFSMVQMPEQYKFIYQYLQYWLKEKKMV